MEWLSRRFSNWIHTSPEGRIVAESSRRPHILWRLDRLSRCCNLKKKKNESKILKISVTIFFFYFPLKKNNFCRSNMELQLK